MSGTGGNSRRPRIAGERKRTARSAPATETSPAPDDTVHTVRTRVPSRAAAARSHTPAAPETESAGAPAPRWLVPLIALTIVATLLAGWMGWQTANAESPTPAAEPQVLPGSEAVGDAAEAATVLFSFSYDRLDQQLEQMRPYLTDDYADQYFATFPDKVRQRLVQRQVQVETTVVAAAAMDCGTACDAAEAQVLLFLDKVARSVDEGDEQVPNRVILSMQLEGDQWRVDGVESL